MIDISCQNCVHLKVCSMALPPYTMSCEEWLAKEVAIKKEHKFSNGLLSCPFCDGEAKLVKKFTIVEEEIYWVECQKCSAMMGRVNKSGDSTRANFWTYFNTPEEAVHNWNTRCGIEIQDNTIDRVKPSYTFEP